MRATLVLLQVFLLKLEEKEKRSLTNQELDASISIGVVRRAVAPHFRLIMQFRHIIIGCV
jgi:hypothetical protein